MEECTKICCNKTTVTISITIKKISYSKKINCNEGINYNEENKLSEEENQLNYQRRVIKEYAR